MATVKTRINISVSKDMRDVLRALAKRDELPVASKTVDLLDRHWNSKRITFSKLADNRLKKNTKWLTHEEVWGKKNLAEISSSHSR